MERVSDVLEGWGEVSGDGGEAAMEALLAADWKSLDGRGRCRRLPAGLVEQKEGLLKGVWVLQVQGSVAVHKSINDQREGFQGRCGPRMLKLLLTDGSVDIWGVEVLRCPQFDGGVPPGSKLAVLDVKLTRGILHLRPKCVRLLRRAPPPKPDEGQDRHKIRDKAKKGSAAVQAKKGGVAAQPAPPAPPAALGQGGGNFRRISQPKRGNSEVRVDNTPRAGPRKHPRLSVGKTVPSSSSADQNRMTSGSGGPRRVDPHAAMAAEFEREMMRPGARGFDDDEEEAMAELLRQTEKQPKPPITKPKPSPAPRLRSKEMASQRLEAVTAPERNKLVQPRPPASSSAAAAAVAKFAWNDKIPFAYLTELKTLGMGGPRQVRVKDYVFNLKKANINQDETLIEVVLQDGISSAEVVLSNAMVDQIRGMSQTRFNALGPAEQAHCLEAFSKRIRKTQGLMRLEIRSSRIPVLTSIEPFTVEHARQLLRRVRVASGQRQRGEETRLPLQSGHPTPATQPDFGHDSADDFA